MRERFSSRLKVGGRSSWLKLDAGGCGDDGDGDLDGAEGDVSCVESETVFSIFSGFDSDGSRPVMDLESFAPEESCFRCALFRKRSIIAGLRLS